MYFPPHGPVTRSVYECLVFPRDRTVKQAREVFFFSSFEMWFLNFPAITRESLDAWIELRLRIKRNSSRFDIHNDISRSVRLCKTDVCNVFSFLFIHFQTTL